MTQVKWQTNKWQLTKFTIIVIIFFLILVLVSFFLKSFLFFYSFSFQNHFSFSIYFFAFGALTLLIRRQQGRI